jgi:hypothetical protein
MDSKLITRNKMSDLALGAGIFNMICWLVAVLPNVLLTSWPVICLAAISLSAGSALVAGIIGLFRVRALGTGLWQSLTGVIIGFLNAVWIVFSLIGIYAMVNAPF